jgi:hypothetical protein
MVSTAKKEKSVMKWTVANKAMLLQTLHSEKANSSWGDNNPKPSAYTTCELALAGSEKVSGGGSKGVSAMYQESLAVGTLLICQHIFTL